MNCKNAVFYDLITTKELMEIATIVGLDTCCDMDLIKPYLKPTDKILDVGGGYGRVLAWLIKEGFTNLATVERGQRWLEILRSSFSDKVKIYDQDLIKLEIKEQFDVILWMWASIFDFSPEEQANVLKKLASLLTTQGILVIDTVPTPIQPSPLVPFTDGQNSIFNYQGHEITVYSPSLNNITLYGKELGMQHKHLEYLTATGRRRIINILSK